MNSSKKHKKHPKKARNRKHLDVRNGNKKSRILAKDRIPDVEPNYRRMSYANRLVTQGNFIVFFEVFLTFL